jgi:hypothetical protein
VIYGISQNPVTNDYVVVLYDEYPETFCKKCVNIYTNTNAKWCRLCQMNDLKKITNRTNGNEKIDNLIQEMQSKIEKPWDTIFEWIPYNQLDDIKIRNKDELEYSAIWKDGPLTCINYKYTRNQSEVVILKLLHNSQNITSEHINEV